MKSSDPIMSGERTLQNEFHPRRGQFMLQGNGSNDIYLCNNNPSSIPTWIHKDPPHERNNLPIWLLCFLPLRLLVNPFQFYMVSKAKIQNIILTKILQPSLNSIRLSYSKVFTGPYRVYLRCSFSRYLKGIRSYGINTIIKLNLGMLGYLDLFACYDLWPIPWVKKPNL